VRPPDASSAWRSEAPAEIFCRSAYGLRDSGAFTGEAPSGGGNRKSDLLAGDSLFSIRCTMSAYCREARESHPARTPGTNRNLFVKSAQTRQI